MMGIASEGEIDTSVEAMSRIQRMQLPSPQSCSNIEALREVAHQGGFISCQGCPRHPEKRNPVFAEGCPEHQTSESPIILFVMCDPSSPQHKGIIGCSTDGRVCPWCHTDTSANNFRERLYPLIVKVVPCVEKGKGGRYPTYCINAVLHGPERNAPPSSKAIKACSEVLRAYVHLLKPKLVVALGVMARTSLAYSFDLPDFEKTSHPLIRDGVVFWWTYHQAGRSFNRKTPRN